jgi:hypothetical protein
MVRKLPDNSLQTWRPTSEMLTVAELLASGYSQNRAAALSGVPQRTISDWWQDSSFSEQFRQLVADLQVEFMERRESIIEQSETLALLLYHQGLTGERSDEGTTPLDLARDLLKATVWPARNGRQHKQFGAP